MNTEDTIKYIKKSRAGIYNAVDRENFVCLEINISSESRWLKEVYSYAQKIVPNLNIGQANSSEKRSLNIVEIDNLSGIIAEYACYEVLKWRYGKKSVFKPGNNSSYNQVDLELYNGKTIEVRSSCVRNGIDFAIFAQNRNIKNEQYFDVIGPYSNGYKKVELWKDYYMRVLYECDKRNFMDLLKKPIVRLYITGGVAKKMMGDPNYYQIKHLTPAGGQVKIESDYRVIPLAKSLDINEFFAVLESENKELIKMG